MSRETALCVLWFGVGFWAGCLFVTWCVFTGRLKPPRTVESVAREIVNGLRDRTIVPTPPTEDRRDE